MAFPQLVDDIEVHTDELLDDLWDRFEIFEALHHTMTIDNPMASGDLDRVVELLQVRDGDSVLDLACGHGELLRRLRRAAGIEGVGVDLSPWMLRTAHRLASDSAPDLRWVLSDAKHFGTGELFDRVTCLGASWVWHGLAGTIRSIASRCQPGGRIAIGDMHVRPGLEPATVAASHGAIDPLPTIEQWFDDAGVDLIERVPTADAAWDDYLARTRHAALAWAELHPGDRAEQYLVEQAEWESHHERDREVLTWSVWVGAKR